MQKGSFGLFMFGLFVGALVTASLGYSFGTQYLNNSISIAVADSETKSNAIIGQLRSEQQRATEIVGGIAERVGSIKDTAKRNSEIILGLRELIKLYFPDQP